MAAVPVSVEPAKLEDALAIAEIFLKSFNSDFFQTMFPQNEYGRAYMTDACRQFMVSKEHGSQEGEPVATTLIWIIRPEDNGTWSWRKRWPPANAGQKDELLDEFFSDMASQHERVMGNNSHVCYAQALLQRGTEIADQLGYPMYLDAEEYIVHLYSQAGFSIMTDVGQSSQMIPMMRPAKG
ncbi:hypothetical protein BDP81DRAFT_397572 [Colletotrichum phormii]|uniref:N-acetyltransferase domain-containing protein n=1 Tax=Colletotrichum phormii TaxID=359342 RepID=A0AAI9ZK86_9PEZI|nr:uncharacterized protein BDP81DRAFT_397572 [Colletotrichum phormii]KAK1625798.1 hypothetical protein BDP81DRAFT_397572 [Colletotrichum phormii]